MVATRRIVVSIKKCDEEHQPVNFDCPGFIAIIQYKGVSQRQYWDTSFLKHAALDYDWRSAVAEDERGEVALNIVFATQIQSMRLEL